MRYLRALTLLLLLAVPVLALDWPGWLGPKRDGSTTEKIQPWKGDLKVAWREKVGPGHSSPVVVGGVAYLHTQVPGKEAEELTAYEAGTGKKLWATSYARPKFSSPFGTGPQATPAVSDGKVYTFGPTSLLTCFDAKTGSQVWQFDSEKEFKAPRLFFGSACSPLVDGNNILMNIGARGASVVAFTKGKGEVAWKTLDDKASYSSGVLSDLGGVQQAIFLTQQGLRGIAPADGKKLWDFPLVDKLNESSTTPVIVGDTLLASSITYGMVGLKLGKKADGSLEAKQIWKNPKLTCYFSTPIAVGPKHVYLVTGALSFKPVSNLHCIELETGKILWTVPKVGKYHAALLRTGDDKLLMLTDLGDLVLFDPDPKEYKELSRSKVVRGEQIWAHPVLVDGKLYFRDEKELICLEMP